MTEKISVIEFEAKVLEKEEIVIRVRASFSAKVSDYNYDRKAAKNQTITGFLTERIKPALNGYGVVIVGGDYTTPHSRTKLGRLRKSYEK